MATITAAAAGGNWNAGTTWVGGVAPTAADDVRLDATSGNVAITAAAACRSLDCSGYTGTLTHGAFTLSIGDGTAGAGGVAFRLSAGMTYTLSSVTTSALTFLATGATSATTHIVDCAGKSVGNVTFSGFGAWALTSALNQDQTASLTHTGGTLRLDGLTDNAGLSHSVGIYACTGSSARTSVGGTCTLTMKRNGTATHFAITGSSVTQSWANATLIGAPTSTGRITYTYSWMAGQKVGTLILNGEGERNLGVSGMIVGTLTRNGTANYFDQVNLPNGGTVTVDTALNLIAASADHRMTVWPNSTAVVSTLVLTGAALNFQHIDWQDIRFDNGGANLDLSANVGGSGDCGGNSITGGATLTFTQATTQTWQGGGGSWNDPAKWTSRVPLVQDNVVFASAFAGTPTIICNRKWLCRDITFAASSGNVNFRADVYECYITGNATYRSNVTKTVNGGSWIYSARTDVLIQANGMPFQSQQVTVQSGPNNKTTFGGGTNYGMLGQLSHRCGHIVVEAGTQLWCDSYVGNANNAGARCTVSVYGVWVFRTTGTAFSVANAGFCSYPDVGGRLTLANTAAGTVTFATSGLSFPHVTVAANSAGTFAFTGGGSFPRLPRPISAGTATITFAAGTTTTIRSPGDDDFVNGTNVLTYRSGTGGSPATISKANGRIRGDYLALQDLTAAGGAVFLAGANGTNTSGNTGWTFSAAAPWVPQSALMA